MPNPPIRQYVSDSPAIAALTARYGDRLQRMTFYEAMLTIMLLASALSDGFLDRDIEPTVEEQIRIYTNKGYTLSRELQTTLTALDTCDEKQVTALLVALIGYTSAQLVNLALSG